MIGKLIIERGFIFFLVKQKKETLRYAFQNIMGMKAVCAYWNLFLME